ncbi:MAG: Periplasmic component of the Tol biopolymer transport system-like protein [Myxococcales bacterium]|nr:Periplasmic component of the Tol biopolymer transport system-like protein [Myxococcales bacterium]
MMIMERRDVLVGILVCVVGCGDSPPGKTYFERNIEPILQQKCAGNTSGCHSINAAASDPYQFAAGNLDVTSFEKIQKRRDVLERFGAYPKPLLLIKAVAPSAPNPMDPNKLLFQYGSKFLPIDVLHGGGSVINVSSDAYFALQTWLDNGATENGLKPATPAQTGNGTCSKATPSGFDPTPYTMNANFTKFKDDVQPVLKDHGCTSSNCHGAPQSDFYITCGDDDTQLAFNFSQAWSFVNMPVDDSQILRVPLAVSAGGRGHTGGDQFSDTGDGDYTKLRDWANAVGVLDFAKGDPVKTFFKDNVQPILLQRGCSFQACHSPAATNDFKLRSGTQGFFSAVALERNYDLLKNNFMALEFPDARRGRAVAKAILGDDFRITSIGGIAHRAGAVLETPGATASDPTLCPPWNAATSTPFCTIQEWINRERAAIPTTVTAMSAGDPVSLVYVERAQGSSSAGRLEFDTFQGTADLRVANTTFAAGQAITPVDVATSTSLLGGCAGATAGAVDVQAPDVANDGTRVVFAMRRSTSEPLTLWTVNIDGTSCSQLLPALPDSNGIKVHDFDPAWSPDGTYVVFASTRGKAGATLSRKRFLPQSDLWRVKLADKSLEQMTFLSNSEISPQFMREGRVTMTTEKTSDTSKGMLTGGFYQLSGRRINWDLTDYHPLLAQRADSAFGDPAMPAAMSPSIGYSSATDIREANNGDFMLVLSDVAANGKPVLPGGAGALGIFNRSIGPFEAGRTDAGYLPSLKIIDGNSATGHTGATSGYRSPFYLPDGSIMASYAANLGQLDFRIVSVSPRTGARTTLVTGSPGNKVQVDAVLAYKFPARQTYSNRRQLVFGGTTTMDTGHAVVHMPDAPMVFTLLTANLRRGRPVDAFRTAKYLAVYSEDKCGAGCTANTNGIFQARTLLGTAPLADDGSVKIQVPSGTGVVFELQDANKQPIITMGEEHQMGPGEQISMGISQKLFDAVCGGCHGSVTGHELDIAVTADALTGASQSLSASAPPTAVGN